MPCPGPASSAVQDAFAAMFAQEATEAAEGCPCYSFPLPAASLISHRVRICQAVTEDPGKDPLAKGHNATVKLTGLAYGPSVAYGFNTEVIHQYNDTGKTCSCLYTEIRC